VSSDSKNEFSIIKSEASQAGDQNPDTLKPAFMKSEHYTVNK